MRQWLFIPAILCFLLLYSTVALCQARSTDVKELTAYVYSIDSLIKTYKTNLDSPNVVIGNADGEYTEWVNNKAKTVGGFSMRTARNQQNDSIYFIGYEGNKNDVYVTKRYYYKGNSLVFAQITIEKKRNLSAKPYIREEYFRDGKTLLVKTVGSIPNTKEKSLLVASLHKDGINYLQEFNKEYRE